MDDHPYSATVARRVAALRRERGWSAQQLSERLEAVGCRMIRSTLANMENGRRDTVTVDELYAFARVFGVPVDCLAHDRPACPTCNDDPPAGLLCTACGRVSPPPASTGVLGTR